MSEGGPIPGTGQAVCVFCEIMAGQVTASPVYEDDLVQTFRENVPINPAHTPVIPKAHSASLSALPEMVGARVFTFGQRLVGALRRSGIRCEGVNLFLSDREPAGQEVLHCHPHVLPRFRGDPFRVGHDASVRPSQEELDAIARRVPAALE